MQSFFEKYNKEHKLALTFLLYFIGIYSGVTGELFFLHYYIPGRRGSEFYFWQILSLVTTLIVSSMLKKKDFKIKEDNRRLIVGIMAAIVGIMIYLTI